MASVLGHNEIGRSTFPSLSVASHTHVSTDPAANLDVISRMLYVDGTSVPTARHQEHRLQLVAHLPYGTDLAGKTNDLCLICSEEIPFDVQAEQVLPAQCRRKHVWGKQYCDHVARSEMLMLHGRTLLDYISPDHYSVCPHMRDLSCESAAAEPANIRKSKVYRAGHVACGYFVSKMWRTLAKCSVGCDFLQGCICRSRLLAFIWLGIGDAHVSLLIFRNLGDKAH